MARTGIVGYPRAPMSCPPHRCDPGRGTIRCEAWKGSGARDLEGDGTGSKRRKGSSTEGGRKAAIEYANNVASQTRNK